MIIFTLQNIGVMISAIISVLYLFWPSYTKHEKSIKKLYICVLIMGLLGCYVGSTRAYSLSFYGYVELYEALGVVFSLSFFCFGYILTIRFKNFPVLVCLSVLPLIIGMLVASVIYKDGTAIQGILNINYTGAKYFLISINVLALGVLIQNNTLVKSFGYILYILTWFELIKMLGKWVLPHTILSSIFVCLYFFRGKTQSKYFVRVFGIAVMVLLSFWFISISSAHLKNLKYGNWKNYIERRVTGSDEIFNNTEEQQFLGILKDGGRFAIWEHQIEKLKISPYKGIGFGNKSYLNVDDHNMYIFLMTRFGVVFGSFFMISLFMFVRNLCNPLKNCKILNRSVFLYSFLYFVFLSFVSVVYGMSPVLIVFFTSFGIQIGFCERSAFELKKKIY